MPTFPADETLITVTGFLRNFDGTISTGGITFTPDPALPWLQDPASKIVLIPRVISRNLDSNGAFSVVLPATNDPDIFPSAFTYAVDLNIGGTSFGNGATYHFNIALPYNLAGTTIDLSQLTVTIPLPNVSGYALETELQALQNIVNGLVLSLGGGVGGDDTPIFSHTGRLPFASGTPVGLHGIWPADAPFTIHSVMFVLGTGPVGADVIIDVLKNGNSIWTGNLGQRAKILNGASSPTLVEALVPATGFASVVKSDLITATVVQSGSIGTEGSDPTIKIVKA